MLAAYRELKNGQMETTALEIHLSSCPECRAFLAEGNLVGERMRALPEIQLPTDARTRLMRALATEHTRFIQQAPSTQQSIPVPAFLTPYLKEQGQEVPHTIAAFSTADTGPLPLIEMPRKRRATRRRPIKMSSFAIVGLAAVFLMTIMVGGLTSLVILANRGVPDISNKVTVGQISQLSTTTYTTATSYTHIVSAVGNRGNIYYTAYGTNDNSWILAALDNQTKITTPLLANPGINPLLVLSSSDNWLIWLQFDLPKQVINKNAHNHSVTEHEIRTWSLLATYLGTDPASTFTSTTPLLLQKGIFDESTAPTWVHTPIEGIWTGQNIVLAATLDKSGVSHLTRYTLDAEKSPRATELASVNDEHILTSPTANSDGTSLYWSEEWLTDGTMLHSTVWTQKITPASLPLNGRWGHQTNTDTYPLRTDADLFHPQVVNNMLFLQDVKNATTTAIEDTTANVTPATTATPSTQTNATLLSGRTNSAFYALPDQALQGTLEAFSALDDSAIQTSINDGLVQGPQAGARFLLWQNSNKGIGMYDAITREIVPVGPSPIPNNAALLTVNGDTTTWTVNSDNSANNQNTTNATNTVTFGMFNWPTRAPVAP